MARDPGGEISFIEAEQALLHSDADADGAVRHVHEQRRDRARRRAEGGDALGGFSHHRELAEQLGAARGAGGGGGSTSQNIMRWLVSVASTAILVLVVLALLIVAMVDAVYKGEDLDAVTDPGASWVVSEGWLLRVIDQANLEIGHSRDFWADEDDDLPPQLVDDVLAMAGSGAPMGGALG